MSGAGCRLLRVSSLGIALLAIAMVLAGRPAEAREEILSFSSRIIVHSDATLTISETIKVRAEGGQIKRGIYRDLPSNYRDRSGNTLRTRYRIVSVTRDGKPLSYFSENHSNRQRIYMGSRDTLIKSGVYTYVFTYQTEHQVGYFETFDEVYWNVTGDEWKFPILQAEAVVELPPGGKVIQNAAYTGPKGSSGADFTSQIDVNGNATFKTTRVLNPGEGLTIAVGWPKGLVAEPSAGEKAAATVEDNLSMIYAFVGLLLILAYYLYAWNRVGRDPEGCPIVPQHEPPAGFSPASMRYILGMGFDQKAFSAAIVNMAVKGHVKIHETPDGDFSLSASGGQSGKLSKGEAAIKRTLFGRRTEIDLDNEHHKLFSKTITALRDSLESEFSHINFVRNRLWFGVGAVLSAATIVVVLMTTRQPELVASTFIAMAIPVFMLSIVGRRVYLAMKGKFRLKKAFPVLVTAVVFVMILSGVMEEVALPLHLFSTFTNIILIAIVLLNPLFFFLLKAPTFDGRRIMDQIEGFKMYLSVAGQARPEMFHPPDQTPQLFEKLLPYALALDVEHEWSEQFSAKLAGAAMAQQSYHPRWYSGDSWDNGGATRMSDSLGGNFTSAMSSASSAPGSSGSGGGGSSGGGGGGGGGGGF